MRDKQNLRDWEKDHVRRYQLKLSVTTDADIIEQLQKQDSMQGYIKSLIRRDIDNKQSSGA